MSTQNVFNPSTGQYGYQIPGAPPQPGWQPITAETPTPNKTNTSASAMATSNLPPPPGSQSNPTGVNDMSFLGMMNKINNSFQQTNTLLDQKNALLHASMGNPLDATTLQNLPTDIQQLIQSGNRDAMRLQAQALNDQANGNGSSVASSIQFLTQGYENSIKTANDQKQSELDNLIKLSSTFVDHKTGTVDTTRLGKALQTLYPGVDMSGILSQLQGMMPVSEYNKGFYQGVNYQDMSPVGNISGNMSLDSAIVSQESGGNYNAVSSAGALGRYQIMPEHLANVINPAIGKPLDPNNPQDVQTFLNTPELQDQAYKQIMGQLNTQYGSNLSKVIAAYYGGPGAAAVVGTPQGDAPQQGGPSINDYVSQVMDKMNTNMASPPDDMLYNQVDPMTVDPKSGTGRTYGSMYQNAWDMLNTGKPVQQYLGGLSGSSGPGSAIKNTIQNIAAAIEKLTGKNSSQFAALYKADSSAATQNIQRLARVESITNSVVNQIPRLAKLADEVAASGVVMTESDLQGTQADIERKFGNTPAAQYLELVQTIRADYSANNAALAGSRGGEFFSRTAEAAIPVGLTGDQYNAIKDTMVGSTQNIRDGINAEVQSLIGTSGGIGNQNQVDTGGNPDFASMSDADLKAWISRHGGQ